MGEGVNVKCSNQFYVIFDCGWQLREMSENALNQCGLNWLTHKQPQVLVTMNVNHTPRSLKILLDIITSNYIMQFVELRDFKQFIVHGKN